MKTIILALCIFAVAFAAPDKARRPPKTDEDGNTLPPPMKGMKGPKTDEDGTTLPPPQKPSKEEFEALIEECEALENDEKRQDEPELEEICSELARILENGPKGPRPTQEAEKRTFRRNGPTQADLDKAGENFSAALVGLCQGLEGLIELANSLGYQKRSWESIFEGLVGVCTDVQTFIEADMGSAKRDMPSKQEFEALIEECEALDSDEKRQDEPELAEICSELAQILGRSGPKTDEDGNSYPRPTKPAQKRRRFHF